MIDRANEIYTRVKKAIEPLCKNSGQSTEEVPAVFPYLDFDQQDNPVHQRSVDLQNVENAVVPMIQITAYTKGLGKLSNAKKIISLADKEMQSMGFRRTFGPQKIQNTSDSSICRVVARYTRVIAAGDVL